MFELEAEDIKDDLVVTSGNISDSTLVSALWVSGKPSAIITDNKISYTFTVEDTTEKWLHIIYKGDVIMRYKLRMRKDIWKRAGNNI